MANNPLFKPSLVEQYMSQAVWPEDIEAKHETVLRWVQTLRSGTLHITTETSLHADFLKDIFETVLGYPAIVAGFGYEWNLHPERLTTAGGGTADAAIGFFGKERENKVVAPIELKAASVDLDRTQVSRGYTPVQQGWRYANETRDCNWVIVSNYVEIRLYHTSETPAEYELFLLEDLANFDEFLRFYFILSRENFLSPRGPSLIDRLKQETGRADEQITRRLYDDYKQTRIDILSVLTNRNPEHGRNVLINKVQKLMDRFLFICFAEDTGLLPDNILRDTYNLQAPRMTKWRSFKNLFEAIDEGDPPTNIPGYNGGLFAKDSVLDSLDIPDVVFDKLMQLSRFDYASDVSVNILGHIFEQSITDIEVLKNGDAAVSQSKRKGDGIYYTEEYITRFIVERTIGELFAHKYERLLNEYKPHEIPKRHIHKRKSAWRAFWFAYREELKKIRILDPACGSGAFLVAAFDYLLAEYNRVNKELRRLDPNAPGQTSMDDLNKTILNQNLFGVDVNEESVEITKLSLWIKTAERGRALTALDDNIKCGNSIIDDPNVTPLAFNWQQEFPHVFADGGFDVVIGNPPYINIGLIKPAWKNYLRKRWPTFYRRYDMYGVFLELSLRELVKPGGKVGMIVPSTLYNNLSFKNLRKLIMDESHINYIADMGPGVFEDATNETAIIVMTRKDNIEHSQGIRAGSVSVSSWKTHPVPRNLQLDAFSQVDMDSFGLGSTHAFGVHLMGSTLEIVEKVQQNRSRLDDFIVGVQGLITGNNKVFLVSDDVINKHRLEREVCKPFAFASDFQNYTPILSKRYVIYLTSDTQIQNYPNVYRYLKQFKETLENRREARTGKMPWWRIHWPRDRRVFETSPKIVVQDVRNLTLKDRVVATIDTKGIYVDATANVLVFRDDYDGHIDEYCLLALLNSNLTDFFFANVYTDIHIKLQYLKSFPVPSMDRETSRNLSVTAKHLLRLQEEYASIICGVVHRILVDLCPAGSSPSERLLEWYTQSFAELRTELQNRYRSDIPLRERSDWEEYFEERRRKVFRVRALIDTLKRVIDRRVYALYGLLQSEIDYVEAALTSEDGP